MLMGKPSALSSTPRCLSISVRLVSLTHEALDDTYLIKVNAIVEPTAKYRGEEVVVLGLPHAMRVALERKEALWWKERPLDQVSPSDDSNDENESESTNSMKIWIGEIVDTSIGDEVTPHILASARTQIAIARSGPDIRATTNRNRFHGCGRLQRRRAHNGNRDRGDRDY